MGPETQAAPDYYVWEVPGKPVVVHLHYDAVDRILHEVMRGFGAVPKRGAEVGGVLIGTIERGDVSVVRVEDFEAVECEYQRGPSYHLSEQDGKEFAETCRRWAPDEARAAYAVGFFRSHTRDGMSLDPEDVDLMNDYFPSPSHIALLIKPYGTKVSTAGFFFREDGAFQQTTPLEFPFRRAELSGEPPAPRRSMVESQMESHMESRMESRMRAPAEPIRQPPPGPAYAVTLPSKSRMRSAIWIPLSFVFLLFGVALGLMIALGRTASPVHDSADFSLGLAITENGGNLSVKWNRDAAAVRASDHGVLEIQDGNDSRPVNLDSAQLYNGSMLYRNASSSVRFRLVVYPRDRVSVIETLDWKK